jgi:hypothetical protein
VLTTIRVQTSTRRQGRGRNAAMSEIHESNGAPRCRQPTRWHTRELLVPGTTVSARKTVSPVSYNAGAGWTLSSTSPLSLRRFSPMCRRSCAESMYALQRRRRLDQRRERTSWPLPLTEKPEATVTAGNASGQNDGAAAAIVTTPQRATMLGLEPYARIVSRAVAGVARA